MRVLVTGAGGQLGLAMSRQFSKADDVRSLGAEDLDIRDHRAVLARVQAERPAAIINCAAYTDVDGAEDAPVEALAVNAFAVQTLAAAATSVGAALVHFSTDFVFDGEGDRPYTEEDRPNPRSVYASSKLLGEWFAKGAGRHYVLRVESLFGGLPEPGNPRRTSVDRIVESILEGRETRVFQDRTVSPSYTADVVAATRHLLMHGAAPGLYHCANTGTCTWLDLAVEIGRQCGVTPNLLAVHMADVKLRASRPTYCALSNSKLREAGFLMPSWQDAIRRYLTARGVVLVDR